MNKAYDVLVRYQNYFLGLSIFLSLLAVSIKVSGGRIELILGNYPLMAILLIAMGLLCAIIYIQIDKFRIDQLSRNIHKLSRKTPTAFQQNLSELTSRQEQIYHLIVKGKSNKEIMTELFIEQSTLKTHINKIYKRLEVSSRKELRNKSKGS